MRAARAGILTVLVMLMAAPVAAQTGKNALTIFGGFSLIDATTARPGNPYILAIDRPIDRLIFPPIFGTSTSLDGSGELGVRYGRDVTDTITLTGDFAIAPGHELTAGVTFECPDGALCIAGPDMGLIAPDFRLSAPVVAYHYGGDLQLKVLQGTLTPSVIAGLGGVTFVGNNQHRSSLAFRVGGSVSAAVGSIMTGIELIDVIISDHFVTERVEHDPHVRITFGVRW